MDIKRMHEMIEKLSESAECEFAKGIECVDTEEMGKVTDMLKDLAEAMYYRTLTKSMDESDPEQVLDMFERYGDGRRYYDRYRYENGRFAPKGRGTRRGYDEPPYWHMTPEMYHDMEHDRDIDRPHGRMYYTEPTIAADGGMRDRREGKMDCQHFFRQIFLGYFSDIVQAFDTLRKNVCGDDYTSLHNPIVLSSVLPAYGMFHSIQILFL